VVEAEPLDTLFREAVAAIDAGDVATLERLLAAHPRLVRDRLDSPEPWLSEKVGAALQGFFRRPYLMWFVAEDPARNGRLPANIAGIARTIIGVAAREGMGSLQEQLDYTLRLVTWSRVAHECGVQLALIDVLVDAGASTRGTAADALVNGHLAAAAHLVERGDPLTLPTALCLGRTEDVSRLARSASNRDRQNALVLAALNGQAEALATLIGLGVSANAHSTEIHSHATALHHAVGSGSLDAVMVLVDAGAETGARDSIHDGTPLDWAEHYQAEHGRDGRAEEFAGIAMFLRDRGGRR
jgi:peptide-methionine (S)-S-oxide reductase